MMDHSNIDIESRNSKHLIINDLKSVSHIYSKEKNEWKVDGGFSFIYADNKSLKLKYEFITSGEKDSEDVELKRKNFLDNLDYLIEAQKLDLNSKKNVKKFLINKFFYSYTSNQNKGISFQETFFW